MQKPFFVSHAMVYDYDTMDTNTIQDKVHSFTRTAILVKAAPGVTEQDILAEVQAYDDEMELNNYLALMTPTISRNLMTTLTETEHCIICLGYYGFLSIVEGLKHQNHPGLLKRERYAIVAKDLIKNRDN